MPRAIVTTELSETLRSIRLQNKIQAKDLALHIEKSPAFISKLENGNLQTIETSTLYSILQFISGEHNFAELAEQIYASLRFKYSSKEIEEQLWFTNFDTVECRLPIPATLIDYINNRLETLNISRTILNARINANESLPPEDIHNTSIEFNQWYHRPHTDGYSQSIKIRLTEQQMNNILDKTIDVSPYIFVFSILFYTLKIEKYNTKTDLSSTENNALIKTTTDILNSYKFLSISEKNNLIAEKESKEDVYDLLTSFDKTNMDILNDILIGFRYASDRDIKSTNKKLQLFSQNMHWDLGFMLKVISLDFKALENTSFNNKKALIEAIQSLISKYAQLSRKDNIEEY